MGNGAPVPVFDPSLHAGGEPGGVADGSGESLKRAGLVGVGMGRPIDAVIRNRSTDVGHAAGQASLIA